MAGQQDQAVVLMSIKPHWAQAIMDGRKRVEFRRARFGRTVTHVIVYATRPVQRVVGYFEVAGITEATPSVLWADHSAAGEIDEDDFRRYYEGAETGVAIHVGRVEALDEPISLGDVVPGALPPQSYRYAAIDAVALLDR